MALRKALSHRGGEKCRHLGRKQVTRSRSGGNVRSKVACESVAESFVEGDKAEIQIDGPDEVLSARNQEGKVRGGKGLRLVFL